jgi:hypothetical protein
MESSEHTGAGEGEKVAFLFQHDTVLPVQYFEPISRKAQLEPEKRLTLAILQDAADCFQKYMFARDDMGRAIFDETEQWIMEENTDWLFSFESICECLGFDPEYIRKGLLLWKNSHLRLRDEEALPKKTRRSYGDD